MELDTGHWTLDTGHWTLELDTGTGYWNWILELDIGHCTLDPSGLELERTGLDLDWTYFYLIYYGCREASA
jgi:hypothetical protein